MAGAQITTKTTEVESQRLGYMAVSLDEWDTTNEPEITAGSKVEVGGSLYGFPANEDIDPDADWGGFGNSTQIYGYFEVAGANITSKLTTTAPAWDEEKQGWYDATNTYRYWGGIYKDSSGNYAYKFIYSTLRDRIISTAGIKTDHDGHGFLKTRVYDIGAWNMESTAINNNLLIDLDGIVHQQIRFAQCMIRRDDDSRVYRDINWASYSTVGSTVSIASDGVVYRSGEIDVSAGADTAVVLRRAYNGSFNTAHFDSTGFNRGYLTITYEE